MLPPHAQNPIECAVPHFRLAVGIEFDYNLQEFKNMNHRSRGLCLASPSKGKPDTFLFVGGLSAFVAAVSEGAHPR